MASSISRNYKDCSPLSVLNDPINHITIEADSYYRVGLDSGRMAYLARALDDDKCAIRKVLREERTNNARDDAPNGKEINEEKEGQKIYGVVCEGQFRVLSSSIPGINNICQCINQHAYFTMIRTTAVVTGRPGHTASLCTALGWNLERTDLLT